MGDTPGCDWFNTGTRRLSGDELHSYGKGLARVQQDSQFRGSCIKLVKIELNLWLGTSPVLSWTMCSVCIAAKLILHKPLQLSELNLLLHTPFFSMSMAGVMRADVTQHTVGVQLSVFIAKPPFRKKRKKS